MKISYLISLVLFVGMTVLTLGKSVEAVVSSFSNTNQNQSASENQINKQLNQADAELQEIVLLMKGVQDQREGKIEDIRKNLERILRTPGKRKAYCIGKIAWALGEKCPE